MFLFDDVIMFVFILVRFQPITPMSFRDTPPEIWQSYNYRQSSEATLKNMAKWGVWINVSNL